MRFVALFVVAVVAVILSQVGHAKAVEVEEKNAMPFVEHLPNDSCPKTPFNNSDYMVLVLSNQVSFCRTKSDCDHHLVTSLFEQNIFFTIHGLWPQLEKKIDSYEWPQCCAADQFNENGLGALKRTMEAVSWPQVTKFSLWEHEWLKHGTCAVYANPRIPYIQSQYEYFKTAVDMYFLFNANQRLIDAGIRPSDSVPVDVSTLNQIFNAHLGVTPRYTSSYGKGGVKLVSEIWVCVSKQTQSFMNCPASLKPSGEAHPGDKIYIPTLSILH